MSFPLFVVFGSFVVPLVFTFKSVGEIHSTKLMTKAIQRASRAMLESVFATEITKDTKVWRKWGIITTKYTKARKKGESGSLGTIRPTGCGDSRRGIIRSREIGGRG